MGLRLAAKAALKPEARATMPDAAAQIVVVIIVALSSLYFCYKRSLRYLQFFQQEDYDSKRFINWYLDNKAFDKSGSVSVLAIALGSLVFFTATWPAIILVLVSMAGCCRLIVIASREEDPFKSGKIKLKMTARAKRITYLALTLYTMVWAYFCLGLWHSDGGRLTATIWLLQFPLIQSAPLWLIIANELLTPYEKGLQERFANEARALIKKYDPLVIGITGSYGKTSTKIVLKDVLGAVSQTFTTPGSINSYMGVTREIRERLKPEHKYAVIEMGAYYIGSIKKMCSLTPPKAGIITSIGVMHLERFGSQDAVFRAKSELAQAIPQDGILVCNGDNELTRKVAQDNPKRITLLYGMEPEKGPLDCVMYDIRSEELGSHFKIKWKGQEYEGYTGVLGRPMLSNILGVFTLVCALDIPPSVVLAALRNAKTENNRLEPVRASIASFASHVNGTPLKQGQVLRLNDAYNSNPIGFGAALDVLGSMPKGRKVLVTPGMIELGEKQVEENKMAAKKAAGICDLAVIVGNTNKDALTSGLTEGGMPQEKVKEFLTMQLALDFLSQYCEDGDVVLIENDLGDVYETVAKF
jgi:UDP-N-acetylmuramoyl-tripeptide--D-alanyl-D-alanine ligase